MTDLQETKVTFTASIGSSEPTDIGRDRLCADAEKHAEQHGLTIVGWEDVLGKETGSGGTSFSAVAVFRSRNTRPDVEEVGPPLPW